MLILRLQGVHIFLASTNSGCINLLHHLYAFFFGGVGFHTDSGNEKAIEHVI